MPEAALFCPECAELLDLNHCCDSCGMVYRVDYSCADCGLKLEKRNLGASLFLFCAECDEPKSGSQIIRHVHL